MKLFTLSLAVLYAIIVGSNGVNATDITVLHSFTGTPDGDSPGGGLILSGTTLYGVGSEGAFFNSMIFSVNTDGTGYNIVHSFNDLYAPSGINGIVQSDSKFYGVSGFGYGSPVGMVFSINTDGTCYQILHSFVQGYGDGYTPYCGVAVSGSWLYGTTCIGGEYDRGIVYRMQKDGSGYQILHSFTGNDGYMPYGSVTISGNTLYGMSSTNVYSMNVDGTGFEDLTDIVGGFNNLVLNGSTLYGIDRRNLVFSIHTDGSGLKLLHALDNRSWTGLTLVGSTLFGTTDGGASGQGTIFSLNTDGNDYQLIHSFSGGDNDGSSPLSDLISDGTALYGVTSGGGSDESGVVYSIPVPEPSTIILLGFIAVSLLSHTLRRLKQ